MFASSLFTFSSRNVYVAAALLRVGLFSYGLLQDAFSPMKYTDIDYYVFTDAARFVAHGESPYERDTYRYTPLLAWLLLPTTWTIWAFSFGKALFAVGDLVAGALIERVLRGSYGMSQHRALRFASIWLLNPMVATISTRGSSEGLLGVMVIALLWAVTQRRIVLAGALLGLSVHFKIYPFIYAPSIIWWLDESRVNAQRALRFLTPARVTLTAVSLGTFAALNLLMYYIYGWPFLQHTYLHHVTRIDHRHNFSVYNTLLHLTSSPSGVSRLSLESLAFLPQLCLSAVGIPLAMAKRDLASTMLAQTFAFVTFNKVCTSQYFLWYMVFLPFYLPNSSFLAHPSRGVLAAALWVSTQGWWLQQGYRLEFLGQSTFASGLWLSSLSFFVVNAWLLGVMVEDVRCRVLLERKDVK
ncbi:MAG: GPI mannosyltransferase 1 [Thelocarpon impressellum]|nr:MAG: GPI mannosyltransferase 1 [Thelocarpon impressellum]